MNKLVVDYLRAVKYGDIDNYIPLPFAVQLINFIKLVEGGKPEHKSPPVHLKFADTINEDGYAVNMCHRGFAKTTVKEYIMWYIAVFEGIPCLPFIPYSLYVSDSMDNGVKKMRRSMEGRWNKSSFLQEYVPKARFTDAIWDFTNASNSRYVVTGHGAQAVSLDTRLYTEKGFTTMGECKVGDSLYGPDGKLTIITAKSGLFYKSMYSLTLEDDRVLKVSSDHINTLLIKTKYTCRPETIEKNITTTELLELPLVYSRVKPYKGSVRVATERLVHVRNIKPMVYPERDLPIDPYTLGVILGDGRIRKKCGSVELTAHVDEFAHYHQHVPYAFGSYRKDPRCSAATQSIRGLGIHTRALGINVHGKDKFVPDCYMVASIPQRLAVLQGLMDTDGTCSKAGRTVFSSQSVKLCESVTNLTRSLGGSAKIYPCKDKDMSRVELWIDMPVFKLERKLVRNKPRVKQMAVVSIAPIETEASQCIAVDNQDRQYIAGTYIRTHNTGVRGTRENDSRPVLALLDDLLSDTDANSPTIIERIEDTIYNAIIPALHPSDNKVIWSGTPFNASDPLYKAVESGGWNVNVFPVCEEFPCEESKFKGSWPERFTYKSVSKTYELLKSAGKATAFNQEYMLSIMSDEDRLILPHEIQWYSRKTLLQNKGNFNFYITTDFATTNKNSGDFSVISVWAYNNTGMLYWVDGICKKQTMDKNIDDLFELAQTYSYGGAVVPVGIEVSGQQGGFVSWIRNEMLSRNVFFTLASDNNSGVAGIRPNTNKMQRFNIVVPWFKQLKIHFPTELKEHPAVVEAMNELELVSVRGFMSRHDDFADTISMLAVMPLCKPSQEVPQTRGEDDIWSYEVDTEEDSGWSSYIV